MSGSPESKQVLGVLLGGQLIDLVWDSGVEPTYEINATGRVVLTFIGEKHAELFTPR